jgi:Skp family chaperone for outer membrane proteins
MILRTALCATTLFVIGWPAFAQTAPATASLGGPIVPGVCLLSREAIFANAAIGKAASARLKKMSDDAQAEIAAERAPIEADLKAFQAEAAKLTPEQRRTRDQALTARLQPLQAKAQQRSSAIEAARAREMQQIADTAQPVIAAVYQQKKCGLLFDRNSALGGNFANDLTADVVRGLDAKSGTVGG